MISIMLAFIITNLSANTLPWNTAIPSNPMYAPNIIIQNLPWFFPAITLVLMVMTDYIMAIKKGVDTKVNLFAVTISYTILAYIEVAGSLTTIGYFYLFEILMLGALFLMTLFGGKN